MLESSERESSERASSLSAPSKTSPSMYDSLLFTILCVMLSRHLSVVGGQHSVISCQLSIVIFPLSVLNGQYYLVFFGVISRIVFGDLNKGTIHEITPKKH
jgi:hypothetical protein